MLEELKAVVARAKETGNLGPHSASILAKYGDVLIAAVERDGLAHEIAKAAGECRNLFSPAHIATVDAKNLNDKIADSEAKWGRLDALLAKYKPEATND